MFDSNFRDQSEQQRALWFTQVAANNGLSTALIVALWVVLCPLFLLLLLTTLRDELALAVELTLAVELELLVKQDDLVLLV